MAVDFNKWFFVDNPDGILLQGVKYASGTFDYKLKYGPNWDSTPVSYTHLTLPTNREV